MRSDRQLSEPKVLSAAEVEDLAGRLEAFCAGQPIVLLYLHGSHARGTQGALSDVDVAVLVDPAAHRPGALALDLQSGLEDACRRDDVDLVVLNDAGPLIRDRVVRSGRLVFSRSEKERVLFEAAAIKEALDFQHYSKEYDDALYRQLSEGKILGRS